MVIHTENEIIHKVSSGRDISYLEAYHAALYLSSEAATDDERILFLKNLSEKGETADEIRGFADGLRTFSTLSPYNGVNDIVGTGGDGMHTINVSTAAAIVCNATGMLIGKHGNRAVTGASGAADFIESIGYSTEKCPEQIYSDLKKFNFTFVLAPRFNPAFKIFSSARKAIGHRTLFNIMGPLTNPLNPEVSVIGAYSLEAAEKIAYVQNLRGKRGIAVHGKDGMDEASPFESTTIIDFTTLERREIRFADMLNTSVEISEITGKTTEEIVEKTMGGLYGENESALEFISINASLCLYASGKCSSIEDGINLSRKIIKSGKAKERIRIIGGS
ncbi:anthranilate phosphoribosyltransferase [Caldiplasma sukawensis]